MIKKEFPEWLGKLKDDTVEGLSFILNKEYGSGILALRNLDDPSKYASAEFAAIAVDELTKNEESTFSELRSILRWKGIEDVVFMGGTNPGGIGHEFVKKYWIDKSVDDPEKDQFCFVPAFAQDNPYSSESYLNQLRALPEKLRKAYLEGNWDVFEGQYFSEWNRNKHTCQPFTIPPHWMRYRAYDYGREKPACCKWYAVDEDGRVWVYREWYRTGLNADQQAQEIHRLSEGENYQFSVADPAIFSPTGIVDKHGGETIAQAFARYGIVFYPASNRRIDGWNMMRQYLFYEEFTVPKMIYFNTCHNSVRTIPNLIHDEKKPEDLDTKGEDHAADTDRYMLMSLHETKAAPAKNEIEKKLDKLKKKDSITNFNEFYLGQNAEA